MCQCCIRPSLLLVVVVVPGSRVSDRVAILTIFPGSVGIIDGTNLCVSLTMQGIEICAHKYIQAQKQWLPDASSAMIRRHHLVS